MKDLLRRMVIRTLDDVDGLFLRDPQRNPSTQSYEEIWLNHAELALTAAEQQFSTFSDDIDKYGGPEKIVIMGKRSWTG